MEEENLKEMIESYIARTKEDNFIEEYSPEEEGYWRIQEIGTVGGDLKKLQNTLKGKFIDAVAYAVQQEIFYPYRITETERNPGDETSGFIRKVPLYTVKDKGLIEKLE